MAKRTSSQNTSSVLANKTSDFPLDLLGGLSLAFWGPFGPSYNVSFGSSGSSKRKEDKASAPRSSQSARYGNASQSAVIGVPVSRNGIRAKDNTVWSLSSGQDLRGVLDAYGVAWAVRMSKNSMRRKKDTTWMPWNNNSVKTGGGVVAEKENFTYAKIEFDLDLKLLRFKPEDKFPAPIVWSNIDKKKTDFLLATGWQTKVRLKGWWQDQMHHFRGKAKPIVSRDKNWLAWAFVPWRNVDVRFDDSGATFFIEWKPGNGAWFKFRRNGNSKKKRSTSFRLDARPDVQAEELWGIYKSGLLPFRVNNPPKFDQSMMVMTMKLYEWKKDANLDRYTASIYMRLLGVKDQSDKNATDKKWGELTPGSRTPWFIFAGEQGSWQCNIESDQQNGHPSYLSYKATSTGSTCSAERPDNVGDACPWLENIHQQFDVKFLGKLVVMRATDPFVVTKVDKGKHFYSSTKVSRERDNHFYPLYPIYNDHLMAHWGKNVVYYRENEPGMSIEDLLKTGASANAKPEEDDEDVVQAYTIDAPMVSNSEEESARETRRLKRQLRRKKDMIAELEDENNELSIFNEALQVSLEKRQTNLTSAYTTRNRYGTENNTALDRRAALAARLEQLKKERAGWMGLCPGWNTSLSNGRPYYFNRDTGASTWTKPTCNSSGSVVRQPNAANALPPRGNVTEKPEVVAVPFCPGWESTLSNGKPYYFNRATGVTTWTKPECAKHVPEIQSENPVVVAVPNCPGWESTVSNGRPYYFNRGTGVTTWTKPSHECADVIM